MKNKKLYDISKIKSVHFNKFVFLYNNLAMVNNIIGQFSPNLKYMHLLHMEMKNSDFHIGLTKSNMMNINKIIDEK